jgi:hypothetical protein
MLKIFTFLKKLVIVIESYFQFLFEAHVCRHTSGRYFSDSRRPGGGRRGGDGPAGEKLKKIRVAAMRKSRRER